MGKAKQCFVYNTKIIETPTTKEVYFYETPIYSHSNSDSKTSNTQAHKRKVFDEMSAHKQYDSLKRKQKHYEQTRWEIARIVDCNFDNKTKFLTLTFRENIQDITITNKEFKYFIQRLNYYLYQTKVQTLKYIATWEKQKRGAIHYHVIFFDFPFVAKEKLQEHDRARRDAVPEGECQYFDEDYERGMKLLNLDLAELDVNMFSAVNNSLINDGCGLYRGRLILPYEHLSRFQNDLID